mgnify:CR=1 FL=1
MARIEILVEEPSMKEFLTILLPNVLNNQWNLNENYFIRSFEGKNDLQKNIPSKVKFLSNWYHEAVGVVIMEKKDGGMIVDVILVVIQDGTSNIVNH